MADIDLNLVKKIREQTGAGINDCKKALLDASGDYDKALRVLREKGIASASKKSSRVAAQGLVGVIKKDNEAVIMELNCETDFVARADKFQNLFSSLISFGLDKKMDKQAFLNDKLSTGKTVKDEIIENVAIIGENISFRRYDYVSVKNGAIVTYVHNFTPQNQNFGQIAIVVVIESDVNKAKLEELGKKVAMHIAAASPLSLDITSVDNQALEMEKSIYREQAKKSGKPDNIIDKMVEGRIRKYYEETVLLEQPLVMDNKLKVSHFIDQCAKELGSSIKIQSFLRYQLGEGIEKQESNLADEVNKMIG